MSSLVYTSTIHRVLDIPEIVELVFSFLRPRDNADNACVCKQWSNIALDILWRNVDDLHRLFSLLAPLTCIPSSPPSSCYLFARTLNPDDWRRFARYARRVRRISYVETKEKSDGLIGTQVFDEMARSRTELNILPNLTTLEWQSERLRPSLLLMGSTVKHFTVRLPNGPDHKISNNISNFFEDIAVRMPSLTYLDLSFDRPVREIEIRIVHLLQSLHDLQKVVVPVYCLTSRVIECLSALPNLGTIQFEFMERQGKGDDLDVQHFSPTLEESAFPALWDLSFSSHLNDATRFIGNRFGPNNLTSLYVHVLSAGEPSSVHEFITTVSENCKLLTNLYIDQFLAPDAIDLAASRTAYRLTWEDLRPLLSCSKLTSFELRWDVPLNMSQSDIEELASRWPSLKVLSLNSEPMLFIPAEPSPLTLRALIPFAQHCPNLRELGLYLSATAADLTHLNSLALPSKLQPFLRLRKFCVGLSSITEPGSAALFLSQLFPLGCEIVPGVGWPDGFGMPETAGNVDVLDEMQRRASEWYDRWVEVDRVLPMLTRLRLEEREKRNALEDEVEDLRLRCRLLEERKALPEEMDGSCLVV